MGRRGAGRGRDGGGRRRRAVGSRPPRARLGAGREERRDELRLGRRSGVDAGLRAAAGGRGRAPDARLVLPLRRRRGPDRDLSPERRGDRREDPRPDTAELRGPVAGASPRRGGEPARARLPARRRVPRRPALGGGLGRLPLRLRPGAAAAPDRGRGRPGDATRGHRARVGARAAGRELARLGRGRRERRRAARGRRALGVGGRSGALGAGRPRRGAALAARSSVRRRRGELRLARDGRERRGGRLRPAHPHAARHRHGGRARARRRRRAPTS